jgi:hypothetical protein
LRLRERRFVGATFPCPDCHAALTLISLRDGEATVQLAAPAAIAPLPVRTPRTALPSWTASPMVIAWTAAGLVGAVLLVLMTRSSPDPPRNVVVEGPIESVTPDLEPPPSVMPELASDVVVPEPLVIVAPERENPPPPLIVFDAAADPPISALDAIPVVTRPVAAAVLAQRLAKFEQSKPTPRQDLLVVVEDLIGRTIIVPDEAAAALSQSITVSITNGTVAELVTKILAGTEWELALTTDAARLQRRAATAAEDRAVIVPR